MKTEDPYHYSATFEPKEPAVEKMRRPLVAFLLTFMAPGLGHLYAGKSAVAALLVVGWTALIASLLGTRLGTTFNGMVLILVVIALASLGIAVSAWRTAKRQGKIALRPYHHWFLYLTAGVVFSLVAGQLMEIRRVMAYTVPTVSMEPAILSGEKVYAEADYYEATAPERGEIAVFAVDEGKGPYVSIGRVIGLPGERISIRDKVVYIDGVELDDPWGVTADPMVYPNDAAGTSATKRVRDQLAPFQLPADAVFVLGDNRDLSRDSRFYGPLPL